MRHASPAAHIDVSLIICTRDRCAQLVRCLEAIRRIEFEGSWELIIVDNGSHDRTKAVVQEFTDTASLPVIYVFEATSGLGNARNAGIRIAQGGILAFTDDDCYPAPDFLSCVSSAFHDPSLGYISGRLLLHDPKDARMSIKESTTPLTFAAGSFIGSGDVCGANMAFRRAALEQIGGFDPLFGAGSLFSAEDLDAAGRASAFGWKGRYCPEVVVSHHHGRRASDLPRLLKSYGIGAGAYHMKILLQEHQFSWFLRSIYQVRRRLRASVRSVLWEPIGAAMFAYMYLSQSLYRTCLNRLRIRPHAQ
jgi:glycosyltransferase involved in cell wall biosynthesis